MLDVKRFCSSGQQVTNDFSIAKMERLPELGVASATDASAHLVLAGDVDAQGLLVLRGTMSADLPMVCQRCMQTFMYHVESDFVVSPVVDEQAAKALPRDYEPLFLKNDELDLQSLVEDELILTLPVTPLHDVEQCAVKTQHWSFGEDQSSQVSSTNKFAELAKLKRK